MLDNLKLLKEDMVKKGWTICCLTFKYNNVNYIILVKRFVGQERRNNEYALVKLHFMKVNDLKDELIVEANSSGLIIDTKTLRTYFGIKYGDNLGEILRQFTNYLNSYIPREMPDPSEISETDKMTMVNSLSRSDSQDPNKIYCYEARRSRGKRSEFNSDKTKLLRPTLFEYFKNDETISFYYSKKSYKEESDEKILLNFAKRK
ncbi:hypothetical protein BKK49_06075 [Rodentibacter rarus]|uniref:Uncharacterized protein n=1 Tax=Rodentibacter rarus TaxID=1908260 RepID=A0A1V3IQ52_9PAST|nr:DUF6037 family protein [Rodentibacter rarus]OOF40390.1 hypothetical protein BKK49_06075 [Rodentibacter rarus]OOF44367.1 hypothetical protein BKK50_02825 [Rodentibacter rarus]